MKAKFTVREVKLSGDLKVKEQEVRPGNRKVRCSSRKVMTTTSEFDYPALGNEGYTFANVNGVPEAHMMTRHRVDHLRG
jgi:outer membrane protein insertion porin family